MDIKVLKNIVNVARTGSITDAAEQVHVTVQALAAQLKSSRIIAASSCSTAPTKGYR